MYYVNQLCLLVVKLVALYRKHFVVSSSTILPGHQNEVVHRYLFCGLLTPFFCGWAMTTVGMLVGGTSPQPGFLQLLAVTPAGALEGRAYSRHDWLRGPTVTIVVMLMSGVSFAFSWGRSLFGRVPVLTRATCWVC